VGLKPILTNTTSFSALTLLVGSFDLQKTDPEMTYNVFSGTLNPTHFTSYADLSEYVRSCLECQQTKHPTHHKKAPLKSLPIEDVFARFHLDYLGPLPLSNGNRYLLDAIDSTSPYPDIHPTKTCDADVTAKVLYEQVFTRYDCPLSVLTDRGSCFIPH